MQLQPRQQLPQPLRRRPLLPRHRRRARRLILRPRQTLENIHSLLLLGPPLRGLCRKRHIISLHHSRYTDSKRLSGILSGSEGCLTLYI